MENFSQQSKGQNAVVMQMHLKPFLKFIRKLQNFNTKIQSHKESKVFLTLMAFACISLFGCCTFGTFFFYKKFSLQTVFNRKYYEQYRETEVQFRPAGRQNPIRLVISQEDSPISTDWSYKQLIDAVQNVNNKSREWFQNIPQLWLQYSSWRCNFLFNNQTYQFKQIQELLSIHQQVVDNPGQTEWNSTIIEEANSIYYLDSHQRYSDTAVMCLLTPDVGINGEFA